MMIATYRNRTYDLPMNSCFRDDNTSGTPYHLAKEAHFQMDLDLFVEMGGYGILSLVIDIGCAMCKK